MSKDMDLATRLEAINHDILNLERRLSGSEELPLSETVDHGIALVENLLRSFLMAEGKPVEASQGILELWKKLVKGEPTLNTIRDNCRELVYYRNCIDMHREDALPPQAARMVVRTVRHIYLYMHSRAEQRGQLEN